MFRAPKCGWTTSQRPGTYSFSSSCSCSALSSSFRLFRAPWRCSWSSDGSTLSWSSLDWSSFGCFCTETLDGERTKGFGLPSSEADCFGLSEELTFWRQWKHLLTFPLLARLKGSPSLVYGGSFTAGLSQQGAALERCSSQQPKPKAGECWPGPEAGLSQSYQHYHRGCQGGRQARIQTLECGRFPTLVMDLQPTVLSESNSCLPRPCLMGLGMYLGFLNFPACFTYKVFPQYRNFFCFLLCRM